MYQWIIYVKLIHSLSFRCVGSSLFRSSPGLDPSSLVRRASETLGCWYYPQFASLRLLDYIAFHKLFSGLLERLSRFTTITFDTLLIILTWGVEKMKFSWNKNSINPLPTRTTLSFRGIRGEVRNHPELNRFRWRLTKQFNGRICWRHESSLME